MNYTWQDKESYTNTKSNQTLLKWLNPKPNEKILDIGSGNSKLLSKITIPNTTLIAIELERSGCIQSNNSYHHINIINASAEYIPLRVNSIDKAFSNHVIEHLQDYIKFLFDMFLILKSPKHFILAYPNSNALIYKFLKQQETHLQRFTYDSTFPLFMIKRKCSFQSSYNKIIDKLLYFFLYPFQDKLQNVVAELI